MKILLFFLALNFIGFRNDKPKTPNDYDIFARYVSHEFKPSKAIRDNCEWQYAVVKVNTDVNNKIVNYEIINNTHPDFIANLHFLIGYQFGKNIVINKHPIVFCMTIENQKLACSAIKKRMDSSDVLATVFADINKVFDKDPKAIFIPNLLHLEYSFDPQR